MYSVQFLRFVAALLVVLHHSWHPLAYKAAFDPAAWNYAFRFGAVGVHVFFVISGFVMVWTQATRFGKADPVLFAWKRFDRIFPEYWLICFATVVTATMLNQGGLPADPISWLKSLLLFPSHSSQIIFVGWTLSYEIFFYACFAIVLAFQKNLELSLVILSVTLLLLVILGIFLDVPQNSWASVATNSLLIEFLAGSWIAWFFIRCENLPNFLPLAALLMAGTGFTLGFWLGYERLPSVISWGLPSAFLLVGVVALERTGKDRRIFSAFAVAGGASYALYLLHPAAIAWVYFIFGDVEILYTSSAIFLILASTGISIVLSIIAFKYLEPRIKMGIPKVLNRR
nr:acyltransferase [Ruegeria sp. R13_0]